MSVKLDAPVIENNKNSLDKGVFVGKYRIKEVEDKSNYSNQGKKDLYLKLICDQDGNERTLHIFGRFIRDKDRQILKWNNSNNGVLFLFTVLFKSINAVEINDDFSIPDNVLKDMEGKSFIAVQYVNGEYNDKPSYNTWFRFFPIDTSENDIFEVWSNNKPYNYSPTIYETYQEMKKMEEYEQKTNSSEPDYDEEPPF